MGAFYAEGITNQSNWEEAENAGDGREEYGIANQVQYLHPYHHLTRRRFSGEEACSQKPDHLSGGRRHVWNAAAAEVYGDPLIISRDPYGELDSVLEEMTDLKCEAKSE